MIDHAASEMFKVARLEVKVERKETERLLSSIEEKGALLNEVEAQDEREAILQELSQEARDLVLRTARDQALLPYFAPVAKVLGSSPAHVEQAFDLVSEIVEPYPADADTVLEFTLFPTMEAMPPGSHKNSFLHKFADVAQVCGVREASAWAAQRLFENICLGEKDAKVQQHCGAPTIDDYRCIANYAKPGTDAAKAAQLYLGQRDETVARLILATP